MPVEDAIRRINGSGYSVSNLFQRRDGTWQANVVDPAGKAQEFAVHRDPAHALYLAIAEHHKMEMAWYRLMQATERLVQRMEEAGYGG